MRLDVNTVQQVTDACFDLAMDGRLTEGQQQAMLALGEHLRDALIGQLAVDFAAPLDAKVTAAAARLGIVNQDLQAEIAHLNAIDQTISEVTQLVGVFDDLVQSAAKL